MCKITLAFINLYFLLPNSFFYSPITLIGSFSSAIAEMAATTFAAPIISARISPIAADGLIEMPPLSNVTPLPDKHKTNVCYFLFCTNSVFN